MQLGAVDRRAACDSDRGSQYASHPRDSTLRESGILASMGSRGVPNDNAAAENLAATIRKALIYRETHVEHHPSHRATPDRLPDRSP